ncbi:MAG: hypothetical protein ACOYJF_07730 [Prevotella sp.]|jgi:hypothetical protein
MYSTKKILHDQGTLIPHKRAFLVLLYLCMLLLPASMFAGNKIAPKITSNQTSIDAVVNQSAFTAPSFSITVNNTRARNKFVVNYSIDGEKTLKAKEGSSSSDSDGRKNVQANEQLTATLKFKSHEQTKYKFPQAFDPIDPVIIDQNGEDVTDQYTITYSSEAMRVFQYSNDPYDENDFANYKRDSYLPLINGKDNAQSSWPDDYIITITAKLNDWSPKKGILPDEPAIAAGTTTVKGQFYSTNHENVYTVNANQYVLHVLKRCPKIVFNPDPNDVKIVHNYVMTADNRFEVKGAFVDELRNNETDSLIYEDADNEKYGAFWYTFFVPDSSKYNGENDEDLANNNQVKVEVTGSVVSNSRTETNVQELLTVYDENGNPVLNEDGTVKKELVTGTRYWTQKGWNTDDKWKITFHGKGKIPLNYTIRPWNSQKWDISPNQTQLFTIVEKEPTHLVVDPTSYSITVGETAPKPSVKVVNDFGEDRTAYYNITLTPADGATNYITWNETSCTATGKKTGDATINVTATKKTDEELEGMPYKDIVSDEVDPASYVIHVGKNASVPNALYEVIYDENYFKVNSTDEIARDANKLNIPQQEGATQDSNGDKMGKMHFIGDEGSVINPGSSIYSEMPGVDVTFDAKGDADWEIAKSEYTSNDNSNDTDGKRMITTTSSVTFGEDSNGNSYTSPADDHMIPVSGGFVKLEPTTNGFLTIDVDFPANSSYFLIDSEEKEPQEIANSTSEEKSGEFRFAHPLLAGHTYYLYPESAGLSMHGLFFKPAFVINEYDTRPYTKSTSFKNGYTGMLPALLSNSNSNVKFYKTFDNWKDPYTDGGTDYTSDFIEIDPDYGYITKTIQYTQDKNIRIRGHVLGVKHSDGNQVVRDPFYDLTIAAIPVYQVRTEDTHKPGDRVTTRNIITRMWMTFGGWTKDSEDYPYYKHGNEDEGILTDTWSAAKTDSVGRDNMTIDGFKLATTGSNNPTNEIVGAWSTKEESSSNTFSLPVRGDYLKFEPDESGTLMVYLLQNGMVDRTDLDPDNKKNLAADAFEPRRRAVYIVDESGKPIKLSASNSDWKAYDKAFNGETSSDDNTGTTTNTRTRNYYTECINRCKWYDEFDFKRWYRNYPNGKDDDKFKADYNTIKENWADLNEIQKVIELSDSSYVVPTKAFVRYTFEVLSGKTYYVYCTGSKLGFCGFAFIPTQFSEHSTEWYKAEDTNTAQSETDNEHRNSLPEPSSDVYIGSDNDAGGQDRTIKADGYTYLGTTKDVEAKSLKANFVNANLTRTIKNGKWTTICLPFSLSETKVHEIFGDNAQVVTFDSLMTTKGHEGWAHFTLHVNQLIEAGRPYLIKPQFSDGNDATSLAFNHVSFEGVDTIVINCVNDSADKYGKKYPLYQFVGTYGDVTVPQYSYLVTSKALNVTGGENGGLVRYTGSGTKLNNYRCFIKPYKDEDGNLITKENQAAAKYMFVQGWSVNGSDEVTGIEEVIGDMNQAISANVEGVYTLNGVKIRDNNDVENLPAGVYICQGKKYVIQ